MMDMMTNIVMLVRRHFSKKTKTWHAGCTKDKTYDNNYKTIDSPYNRVTYFNKTTALSTSMRATSARFDFDHVTTPRYCHQ
mmetsp:Transcript_49875/g.60273  ORF Transcript_49875/g.60273 Transcript_49875/m.60273 type:complete len:81 (-) Transcript_49875:139-381(-)